MIRPQDATSCLTRRTSFWNTIAPANTAVALALVVPCGRPASRCYLRRRGGPCPRCQMSCRPTCRCHVMSVCIPCRRSGTNGWARRCVSFTPPQIDAVVGSHSRFAPFWFCAQVLENIICFKWQGRRSNAAAPSRGSRRLAEKMAATELAGKTPVESLALVKRWIDGEYLDLTDGYDASRRHHLHCDEIGTGEVTKMVNDGLVFFSDESEPAPPAAVPDTETTPRLNPSPAPATNNVGPVAGGSGKASGAVVEATEASIGAPSGAASEGPELADQLVDDVRRSPDGKIVDGGGRLELPRRSSFMAPEQTEASAVAGIAVAELGPADVPPSPSAQQQGTQAEEERGQEQGVVTT